MSLRGENIARDRLSPSEYRAYRETGDDASIVIRNAAWHAQVQGIHPTKPLNTMDEKLRIPSRAEEKTNGDIKNDPDTFEPSGEDFAKSRPARECCPAFYTKVIKRRNARLE